jgi:anhydro-N-acetylmuramic acid kinase
MITNYVGKIKKTKKRRILVISASGCQGGIQCIYLSVADTWEILSYSMMPYPQKVAALLEKISMGDIESLKVANLAWLDFKISHLMIDCIRPTLAKVSQIIKTPHYGVLNKLSLWKGPTGENLQQSHWDLTVGDAQFIASSLDIPIFTDFVRQNILAGGTGVIPTHQGNLQIASKHPGLVAFVNIGIISHITVVDTSSSTLIIDSDTGPGTHLIDMIARKVSTDDNFDRDGTLASKGTVDGECLNTLVSNPWFLKPSPKFAFPDQFENLLDNAMLKMLSPHDQLATITAHTARSIYNFFRSEYKGAILPTKIYISGGGVNNLTLMEYLSAYFQPIAICSVEELGIPADMRIPLSLGLTVNSYLSGLSIPWETGNNPRITAIGRWVVP